MDVIDYLVKLQKEKRELVIKSIEYDESDRILVELKDDCGNLVNEKILQLSNAKFDENEDVARETIVASSGKLKRLFCISKKYLKSENLLLCLEEDFVKDFFEFQKALHEYGSKLDAASYAARLDKFCLVKVNDLWYRGSVIQMAGDGAPFCALNDIEDARKIPIENIFPLPTVFTRNPFYFECYYIEKYNEMSKEEIECFDKTIIENNFFLADVEKKDGKFFIDINFS
jgi:Tudor domain